MKPELNEIALCYEESKPSKQHHFRAIIEEFDESRNWFGEWRKKYKYEDINVLPNFILEAAKKAFSRDFLNPLSEFSNQKITEKELHDTVIDLKMQAPKAIISDEDLRKYRKKYRKHE